MSYLFRLMFTAFGKKYSCYFYNTHSKYHIIYGIYHLNIRLIDQTTEFIFLFQIFEWIAMNYVIKTQKDRKIEEILYDYNTENLHEREKLSASQR